jgi:hypothetical protein
MRCPRARGASLPWEGAELRLRRLSWIVAGLLLVLLDTPGTLLAKEHCDPHLVKQPGHPQGYEDRGDRCEGLFIREVSGSGGLLVASLTDALEPFDPGAEKDVLLEWRLPEPGSTRIRVFGLKRRVYYRMDTLRPSGPTSYRWPTDVLVPLKLSSRDVGIVAWTRQTVGGEPQDVYVPVRVRPTGPKEQPRRYTLLLMPGAELREVYVTLSPLRSDGRTGPPIKRQEPLGYGFYPAERGIAVQLPELRTPGLYQLEIGAILTHGGSTTRSLVLYHGAS